MVMNNRVVGVMKMHLKESAGWFYLPWGILLFSFFVNLTIGYFLGGKEPIYTGGVVSIYVYMFVMGILTLAHVFHFAIGLSVRRKDFYFGTSGVFIAVSAGVALILFLLSLMEEASGAWGVNLHFFHLPYINDGSAIEQFLIYFVLMLNMVYLGFLISSIFQRFGKIGLLSFMAAIFIIMTVTALLVTYYEKWGNIFQWFAYHTAFELSMWTIPLVAVYMIVSYLFVRKITV